MDGSQTEKLFALLERICHAIEVLAHDKDISAKRREAGRKGAAAVIRSATGRFLPANTGKNTLPEIKNPVGTLIAEYVRCWQERYKTKARPNVTKAIGVFKKILEERSAQEVRELIQVYCQMSDKWFVTKSHDIATFYENVGKIALARDKGHERPNGEKHWTEIVKERGL